MTDQTDTPSGSRWEPDPDAALTDAALTDAAPTAGVPASAGEPDPAPEDRRAQLRGRAVLAGAATALTLGGGLIGFVIGHATDDGTGLRPANFSHQGPGGAQQGPPSFHDGGDDGFGPPQGSTGTGT